MACNRSNSFLGVTSSGDHERSIQLRRTVPKILHDTWVCMFFLFNRKTFWPWLGRRVYIPNQTGVETPGRSPYWSLHHLTAALPRVPRGGLALTDAAHERSAPRALRERPRAVGVIWKRSLTSRPPPAFGAEFRPSLPQGEDFGGVCLL